VKKDKKDIKIATTTHPHTAHRTPPLRIVEVAFSSYEFTIDSSEGSELFIKNIMFFAIKMSNT